MSKKKSGTDLTKQLTTPSEAQQPTGPIRIKPDSSIQLHFHVKPGAKLSRVAEITTDHIGLQISAPPRDGEANDEVVRYVAEVFKLKGRQVRLVAGMKSRDKVVVLEGIEGFTIDRIMEILRQNQD